MLGDGQLAIGRGDGVVRVSRRVSRDGNGVLAGILIAADVAQGVRRLFGPCRHTSNSTGERVGVAFAVIYLGLRWGSDGDGRWRDRQLAICRRDGVVRVSRCISRHLDSVLADILVVTDIAQGVCRLVGPCRHTGNSTGERVGVTFTVINLGLRWGSDGDGRRRNLQLAIRGRDGVVRVGTGIHCHQDVVLADVFCRRTHPSTCRSG